MSHSNRNALCVILTAATLTVMAGSIIAPVLNLMREGLDVDPASVGLIITTHGLFIALFSPVMGSLIDKIGPKRPFVFGLILYGLAGGSGLFITSYSVLILSRAILGIAMAAFFNGITVLILNLYEGGERNKVMGWRGSTNSLGGIIWLYWAVRIPDNLRPGFDVIRTQRDFPCRSRNLCTVVIEHNYH